MTFNPKDHLIQIRGKDYLPVAWRIAWFREDHPKGSIQTKIVSSDPVIIKAKVFNYENVCLASGFGTAKLEGVARSRPYEGAETAAIGRALAHAGYGTQFTGEEEGENLADSPIENGNGHSILDEELPEINYDTAIGVQNSKGVKYINLDTKALQGVVRGINKALLNTQDQDRIEELQYKKAAALCILNSNQN